MTLSELIAVVGIALVVGCVIVAMADISASMQAKKIDQAIQLSQQETERMRIFVEYMKQKTDAD